MARDVRAAAAANVVSTAAATSQWTGLSYWASDSSTTPTDDAEPIPVRPSLGAIHTTDESIQR